MSEHEGRDAARPVADDTTPTAAVLVGEAPAPAWAGQGGFSRREWQRLAFLRWLYRTGRLSEWG